MEYTEMSHAEFNAVHRDYKLTAAQSQDGKPYVMHLDSRTGRTILVQVRFTD